MTNQNQDHSSTLIGELPTMTELESAIQMLTLLRGVVRDTDRELLTSVPTTDPLLESGQDNSQKSDSDLTHGNSLNTDYLTVAQLEERIPALSQAAIRWQIFNKGSNGLAESGAILRIGRKLIIHLPTYLQWLRSGAEK